MRSGRCGSSQITQSAPWIGLLTLPGWAPVFPTGYCGVRKERATFTQRILDNDKLCYFLAFVWIEVIQLSHFFECRLNQFSENSIWFELQFINSSLVDRVEFRVCQQKILASMHPIPLFRSDDNLILGFKSGCSLFVIPLKFPNCSTSYVICSNRGRLYVQ